MKDTDTVNVEELLKIKNCFLHHVTADKDRLQLLWSIIHPFFRLIIEL